MGSAAGLGAFGFWMFIAAIVVAGIWDSARKRESQQETLRRLVESGQKIDPDVIDKILASSGGRERVDRDFKMSGLIVIFISPGLAILGWFLSKINDDVMAPLLGVSILVGLVGIGLLVAGKLCERWYREDQG